MSNDLEKFLQQAAERLRDKMQQQQASGRSGKPPARPVAPPPPPPRPREPLSESAMSADRERGSDPLSSIDTRPSVAHEMRPHLAQEVSQADEKMAGHLQQVFDHKISNLRSASDALQESTSAMTQPKPSAAPVIGKGAQFLVMLRQPRTLQAAFLASEIFRRRF